MTDSSTRLARIAFLILAPLLLLAPAIVMTAGPAGAEPPPVPTAVSLDSVGTTYVSWQGPGGMGIPLSPSGLLTVTFPVGTDLSDVNVKASFTDTDFTVNGLDVTIDPNPTGLDPDDIIGGDLSYLTNIVITGATNDLLSAPPTGDASVTLRLQNGAPSTASAAIKIGHYAVAAEGSFTKGVPFVLALPQTEDYDDLPGLSFAGATVRLDVYLPDTGGDNITIAVPAMASTDGQTLTVTIPADLGNSYPTDKQDDIGLLMDVSFATWDNSAISAVSVYTEITTMNDPSILRVTAIYGDLFGRTPDAPGLAFWADQLRAGASPSGVAGAITASPEYRSRLIVAAYHDYLAGRVPSQGEIDFWLGQFARGLTPQQLEIQFVGSAEFYLRAGGTDAAWVGALYAHVLHRTPSPAEVAFQVGALQSGTATRFTLPGAFVFSSERLGTLVDDLYRHLLGRSVDPAGRQVQVAYLQGSGRYEQLVGNLVASAEYAGLATRAG